MGEAATNAPRVGLFVTCLVDFFRPEVGFATVNLLESAGCHVDVPEAQTCCGQPAYNSGDLDDTRAIARQVIETFSAYDYVVVPSGSCAGQLHKYPELFAEDDDWHRRARDLVGRTWGLLSFLTDVLAIDPPETPARGCFTYHDSCSGLRQLGIHGQPRQLLAGSPDIELREMDDSTVCCGFGGTFCVKYPEISERMVDEKIRNITATGADTLLGGDLGCLMNIAGRLQRQGKPVAVRHAAEVLAGQLDTPPIGARETD